MKSKSCEHGLHWVANTQLTTIHVCGTIVCFILCSCYCFMNLVHCYQGFFQGDMELFTHVKYGRLLQNKTVVNNYYFQYKFFICFVNSFVSVWSVHFFQLCSFFYRFWIVFLNNFVNSES